MKRKKAMVILLSLFAFLIGLILVYFAMAKTIKNKAESDAEETSIELYSLDTDQAKKLKIENEYGTISLIKDADTWHLESDEAFPVDEASVSSMLSVLKTIKASRLVVENTDNWKEYGLEKPPMTISITLKDGVGAKLELGNTVPVVGGYYGRVDEEDDVYVMEETYYSQFLYSVNELMVRKEAPIIDSETITSLKVKDTKGVVFRSKEDEDGIWSITEPYKNPVRGDDEKLRELFENYSNLSYGECVEYDCKHPVDYGITEKSATISLKYYEEDEEEKKNQAYVLLIGKKDGKGNYYVQPKDTTYIYRMEETMVEDLLKIDAYAYIYPYMITDTLDMLDSIKIETKEKTVKISAKEVTDNVSEVYTAFLETTYKGEIDSSKIKGTDVYATVILTGDAGKKTIKFLQYDDNNYYRVFINGEETFLVEIKEIKSIIKQLLDTD